jgi:spore germination protein YaaH
MKMVLEGSVDSDIDTALSFSEAELQALLQNNDNNKNKAIAEGFEIKVTKLDAMLSGVTGYSLGDENYSMQDLKSYQEYCEKMSKKYKRKGNPSRLMGINNEGGF